MSSFPERLILRERFSELVIVMAQTLWITILTIMVWNANARIPAVLQRQPQDIYCYMYTAIIIFEKVWVFFGCLLFFYVCSFYMFALFSITPMDKYTEHLHRIASLLFFYVWLFAMFVSCVFDERHN